MSGRPWTLAFVAMLIAIAVFFAVMAYLEPTLHDVWHFKHWASIYSFPEYLEWKYTHDDARLGNVFGYWVCAHTVAHVIWNPTAFLLLFVAMFAVAFGRWPRPSEPRDSFRLLLLFALFWIATPYVGCMAFYRPFAFIYVHSFCMLLLLVVVPYRLALASGAPSRARWRTPAMFVAGVVGGMSNEHTVPTAIVAVVACLWLMRRRGLRWAPWMVTGLAGLVAGFLLLFLAPAQAHRYEGLATKTTIVGRILDRGLGGNLDVLLELLGYMTWMAAGIAVALVVYLVRARGRLDDLRAACRQRGGLVLVLIAAATSIFCSMLASPLQGYRLMFASATLLIIAGLVVLDALANDRLVRGVLGLAAAAVVAYHVHAELRIYVTVHREFGERLVLMRAAQRDKRVPIPAYSYIERSRLFYGDDFNRRISHKILKRYFRMRRVNYIRPGPKR